MQKFFFFCNVAFRRGGISYPFNANESAHALLAGMVLLPTLLSDLLIMRNGIASAIRIINCDTIIIYWNISVLSQ